MFQKTSNDNLMYKLLLSISACGFIKFSNTLVLPDPESPMIHTL